MLHIADKRPPPQIVVDLRSNMTVEVAIRTFLGTEWPMNIKRASHTAMLAAELLRDQLCESIRPMADGMFLFRINFRKSFLMPFRHEDGIVTEA